MSHVCIQEHDLRQMPHSKPAKAGLGIKKNPVELLFISSAFVRLSCLQLCQFRLIIATFLRPKAESTRITVTTSNERKKKTLLPSTLSLLTDSALSFP